MGFLKIENTQGQRFYGMHFYPGVAQYDDPQEGPYRVFLNESTLRQMDQSFEGKPVFVEHVEGVEASLDELKKEADGWVVKSFYNEKDGKHWVEFMIVSERGLHAIKNGMRLSNAYVPTSFGNGGLWNAVDYLKEIKDGVFEHLALVQNPRYEESIILSPEEFKKYNQDKDIQLKKLANSHDQKETKSMGLSFFTRKKVENSIDLETTFVHLPKSKKEFTIAELVNQMDTIQNMHGYANEDHMVKCGNEEMTVKDLVKKHMANESAKEEAKKAAEAGEEKEMENSEASVKEDVKAVGDRGGDVAMNKEDDVDETEKKEKEALKKNAVQKALAIKNAGPQFNPVAASRIDLPQDKLARGIALFGAK